MQYEPLDKTKNEIRVLEFLDLSGPVSTEDIIQCSIKNVSLQTPLSSQLHEEDSQQGKFPIAWDKFTKSVDLRDSTLERTTLDEATTARLHQGHPQCGGSRYDWGDFEALSYTWGNTGETKTIYVNGIRRHVPRNLEAALKALRGLEETLSGMCYWIDSLCIDQKNIEERNEQVKRMQEIYGRARAVIVWLGQEKEMDKIAVQRMHRLYHVVGNTLNHPMYHLEWPAIFAFSQKPYWNRCWIIQELAMNHNSTLFLCGEFKLTRRMIQSGARRGQLMTGSSNDSDLPSGYKLQLGAWDVFDRMYRLIGIAPETDIGIGPKFLLDLVRRADATDERDRVYSILGLLDPAISADIIPNYLLSVQQVYTNFMMSFINASKSLEQITSGGISAEQGWPSWVPDLRKPFQRHGIQYMIFHRASSYIPAQLRFIEEEKGRTYLACSGFEVDRIDGIAAEPSLDSHATLSGTVSDRYRGQTLEAIENSFRMGYPMIDTSPLFEVPWNLSYDADGSFANIPSNPEWLELVQSRYFERWDNFRKHNKYFCIGGQEFRTFFAQSDEQSIDDSTIACMISALHCLENRALITTRTGYLGLVPAEARLGDVVAILFGCNCPVVLRPCNDGLYQVIGECYIHGLMNGEIFDQQRDGHVSEREFILC